MANFSRTSRIWWRPEEYSSGGTGVAKPDDAWDGGLDDVATISVAAPIATTTGRADCSPMLQAAITAAKAASSSTNPITVRFGPGIYNCVTTLNASSAQYVTFVGAGAGATIITGAINGKVFDLSSSVGCRIQDLTIRQTDPHNGTGNRRNALTISEATGFRAFGCNIESSHEAVAATNANLPATSGESIENIFTGCRIVVITTGTDTSADTMIITKQYLRLKATSTLMESALGNPDNLRITAAHVQIIGGTHIRRATGTMVGATARSLSLVPAASNMSRVTAIGARFYLDLLSGDINASTFSASAVEVSTGISNTGDWDVLLDGCSVDYESATVTSALSVAGVYVLAPSGNATQGTVRLVGTNVRDLGGSGGTNRKDVLVQGSLSGTNRITKAVYQSGSRIATFGYVVGLGAPALIAGTHMVTEPSPNYQTGADTFASATTKAVTLPVPFPILNATQVTDYVVTLEQPNGTEVYWVTAKTNTGFTLNASIASTATVRWTVTR